MNLKVGDAAPDFELPDQDGKTHKLSDYLGQTILVYFYPRDFTPGCTAEACQIRDNFPKFSSVNTLVLGLVPTLLKATKNLPKNIGCHLRYSQMLKRKLLRTMVSINQKNYLVKSFLEQRVLHF